MPSLSLNTLARLRYSAEDIASLRQLGEYRGKQELFARQRPEVLETLRTAAVIESSESSNRLEGIVAPKARIKALVLKDTSPRNRSEQEIAGYRDALNLLHQSARDMPFATNVILQLHSTVYRYLPQEGGRWKMTDNQIVERGRKVAPFSISELERDCPGVSRDMVRRVLRQMRDEGLLVSEGRGRGARWRPSTPDDGS